MSTSELACTYACLILHDEGIPITAEKIFALTEAANVKVDSYWPGLFAKLFQTRSIEDLITDIAYTSGRTVAAVVPVSEDDQLAVAAAPAAPAKENLDDEDDYDDDFLLNIFE